MSGSSSHFEMKIVLHCSHTLGNISSGVRALCGDSGGNSDSHPRFERGFLRWNTVHFRGEIIAGARLFVT
jgi:hypothetical protein